MKLKGKYYFVYNLQTYKKISSRDKKWKVDLSLLY